MSCCPSWLLKMILSAFSSAAREAFLWMTTVPGLWTRNNTPWCQLLGFTEGDGAAVPEAAP